MTVDREPPSNNSRTLFHADESQSGIVTRLYDIETAPIVGDREPHFAFIQSQVNGHLICVGVFGDIGECFLDDSIQAGRHRKGNLIRRSFAHKQNIDVTRLLKLGAIAAQCRNKTEVFE
jgi:hypothetical protein